MIRYLVTGFPNSFKIVPKHSLVQELFEPQRVELNLEDHYNKQQGSYRMKQRGIQESKNK